MQASFRKWSLQAHLSHQLEVRQSKTKKKISELQSDLVQQMKRAEDLVQREAELELDCSQTRRQISEMGKYRAELEEREHRLNSEHI